MTNKHRFDSVPMANDHVEEHTVAEFIEFCTNGRTNKIGEFNCSCLGISGFLEARGKDLSACKPEDAIPDGKQLDPNAVKVRTRRAGSLFRIVWCSLDHPVFG